MPKNCKNCGAEIPEEAHICLSCLTETEAKTVIDAKDKPLFFSNKKRAAALIATAVLIIILIIICILCLSNKNNMPATSSSEAVANKAIVSTVTEDDGSVITKYDDGSIETKEPDGTVVTKEKDGTVITKQTDGTIKTKKPDGTVKTKKPDGTTITEKPDGTVKTERPNGTTKTEKSDGTIITEKQAETTEATIKPTEKPTEPSTSKATSTEKPTAPPSTEPTTNKTTSTTENNNQPINYDDFTFEYKDYTLNGVKEKKLIITKYTGNDEIVNVPYQYNGEYVFAVYGQAFKYNYKINKLIFNASDNYAPYIYKDAVLGCTQLQEIIFNWSNYNSLIFQSKTIDSSFVKNCNNLKSIKITGSDYYRVYNNGLYYNSSPSDNPNNYLLMQVWGTEWHQPSWCNGANDYVFGNVPTLKEVYINPTTYSLPHLLSEYLEIIHIDENNKYIFNDNGVIYNSSTMQCCYYSQTKQDKSYTFLDGYKFTNVLNDYLVNSKVETFYIPKGFNFATSYGKRFLQNSHLKTIYIQNGNPDIDIIKENFKGNVIVYN